MDRDIPENIQEAADIVAATIRNIITPPATTAPRIIEGRSDRDR